MTDLTRVDASMVNFTASGAGAVQRRLSAALGDVINVKDYGAGGDGSTDDTTAIQAAITAASATVWGGVVYFPRGRYKITADLTSTNVPITYLGDGRDQSLIIQFTASENVFTHVSSGSGSNPNNVNQLHGYPMKSLTVQDLGLLAGVASAGTAIHATFADGTTSEALVIVERVNIRNWTSTSYGFTTGIRMIECNGTRIKDVRIDGDQNTPAASPTSATAFTMTSGLHWSGSGSAAGISHFVECLQVNNALYGVHVQDNHEGFYFTNFELVTVGQGIRHVSYFSGTSDGLDATGGLNTFYSNGHIDCREHGALFTGVNNVQFIGVDVRRNGGLSAAVAGNCLMIEDADGGRVSGCTFSGYTAAGTGSHAENGVYLYGETRRFNLDGNTFNGISDSGVYASGTANNINVSNNIFSYCDVGVSADSSVTNLTVPFSNIYNNMVTRDRSLAAALNVYRSIPACVVGRGTSQTISHNTATAVSWENEWYDLYNWYSSGNPTRLTVPTGVRVVRLTAQIGFEIRVSNTTNCNAYFRKNGSDVNWFGNGIATYVPAGASQPAGAGSMNLVTATIAVTPGDYFELVYYHSEIDAASAVVYGDANGKTTWMSIEAVE
jgi:hypothetical protein